MSNFLTFSPGQVKNFIKSTFPDLLDEDGFIIYQSDTLLRLSEYVLQGIAFERPRYDRQLTLTPLVQPLIIPHSTISTAYGRRLGPGRSAGFYSFDGPEAIAATINEMSNRINETALPYLNESKDIRTIAEKNYQRKWKKFWGNSPSADYDRCLLYAFVGNKREFQHTFANVKRVLENDDRPWAIKEYGRLLNIKENFDNREVVMTVFQEFIDFSTKRLKLDKYGLIPQPLSFI